MTVPSALHRPRGIPLARRLTAAVAVLLARGIALLPPRRIRAVLTAVRRRSAPATYEQAKAARDAVCAASLGCAAPHGCLPRSLATALLCRMSGTWPVWCSGVRVAPPFGAHAWVEANGHPVDEAGPDGYFRCLISVGPADADRELNGRGASRR